jgi:protein-tyrosine phosphatase
VCAGNICRSPMAEAVFQDIVDKAGLSDKISSDSAGTGSWHVGERPHVGTQKVLSQQKIDYKGRARQFLRDDLSEFDYVLAMDHENLSFIKRYTHASLKSEVALFLSYANSEGLTQTKEVPDPYYSGDEAFNRVYDLALKGSAALLRHIRQKHNL